MATGGCRKVHCVLKRHARNREALYFLGDLKKSAFIETSRYYLSSVLVNCRGRRSTYVGGKLASGRKHITI